MNGRLVTLKALETLSADNTELIDVNVVDPISSIIVELQVHNSAAGSMTLHPTAVMTKCEVVDGSDVIYSMTGLEMEALDWYMNKTFRSNYNYCLAGGYCGRYIGYQFGRKLWDKQLALDPTKFRNLQLKITTDLDGGGLAPTYTKIAVYACIFDKKPISPIGFLTTKEIQAVTMAGSGHDYVKMPLDYPYRALLIQSQTAGTEPNSLISNLKLSIDQDKRIPFNHPTEEILRMIMAEYPPVKESYFWAPAALTNRYLMVAPSTRVTANGAQWVETAVASSYGLYDGDGGRLKTQVDTAPQNSMIFVEGWLPHACWLIPMGDLEDLDDLFEVAGISSLILDVNAAGAETHRIVGQQLRRY